MKKTMYLVIFAFVLLALAVPGYKVLAQGMMGSHEIMMNQEMMGTKMMNQEITGNQPDAAGRMKMWKEKGMQKMHSMSNMMKPKDKPYMVATSDGGVVILTGKKLVKYDKDLNLVKEVEIKSDCGCAKDDDMGMMGDMPKVHHGTMQGTMMMSGGDMAAPITEEKK